MENLLIQTGRDLWQQPPVSVSERRPRPDSSEHPRLCPLTSPGRLVFVGDVPTVQLPDEPTLLRRTAPLGD